MMFSLHKLLRASDERQEGKRQRRHKSVGYPGRGRPQASERHLCSTLPSDRPLEEENTELI